MCGCAKLRQLQGLRALQLRQNPSTRHGSSPLAWVCKMCGLLLRPAGAACCLLRLALMGARPQAWVGPTSGRGLHLACCLLAQLLEGVCAWRAASWPGWAQPLAGVCTWRAAS